MWESMSSLSPVFHTSFVLYNCFFAETRLQNGIDVTSICMKFVKIGLGLLREVSRGEGECVFSQKRGGK